ncbi:MAG TPA: glycosyl transferase family 1, partial [Nitrospiraceae bacterium]|nr:glycosyl transferase family 1 [Nitrospiraceae bacterium]
MKGMDYVTITDHNSIEGAVEIAHLPGTFISVEITTYLPENGCKLHVVALNITNTDYQEIMRLRKDTYELSAYLREKGIVHFLAHALYDMNGKLTVDVLERLVLIFNVFEVKNGARSAKCNSLIEQVTASLTEEKIYRLAAKHGIDPMGETPWLKTLVAGSDDHSGLFVARAYTASKRGGGVTDFLDSVAKGRCWAAGKDGDALTLAHSIYGIGYRFITENLQKNKANSLPFINTLLRTLIDARGAKIPLFEKVRLSIRRCFPDAYDEDYEGRNFEQVLDAEAWRILSDTKFLASISTNDMNRKVFIVISRLVNRLMYVYTKRLTRTWPPVGIAGIFHSMGTIGLLHMLTSPYYVAYYHQHRSKTLIREIEHRFDLTAEQPRKIALFTDTLHEINGVAITIKRMVSTAKAKGLELVVITSGSGTTAFAGGIMNFQSVGEFALPEYPELKLHFPPLLEVLDYFEQEGFTAVHASTPGTMGL